MRLESIIQKEMLKWTGDLGMDYAVRNTLTKILKEYLLGSYICNKCNNLTYPESIYCSQCGTKLDFFLNEKI